MEAEGDGVYIGASGAAGSTDDAVIDEYHGVSDPWNSSDSCSQCGAGYIDIDLADRNLVPVRDRIPVPPGASSQESAKSAVLPGSSWNRHPGDQQSDDDCHTDSASKGIGRL